MSKRNVIIGLVLLVIAGIAASVAWNRHQTRQLEITTLSQISDATHALREATAPVADAGAAADAATHALREATAPVAAADAAARARTISTSVARVDRDLAALRAASTSQITLLAAGADTYLHTVRELLRRQVVMLQLRAQISNDIVAVRRHLMTGDRAAANWTATAVSLKNRLEQDFRELQRTVDAHTKIADSFPAVRKVLAELVPDEQLLDTARVAAARDDARAAATAIATEINGVRQFAAPR